MQQLFSKYSRVLDQTEREMKQLQQALSYRAASSDPEEAAEAEAELEMLNNDDTRYLKVRYFCLLWLIMCDVQ
jgi:hypothetical protein